MQFTKKSFMGIELDILTGHPEHDVLFIATQVARAAGLKDPSATVYHVRSLSTFGPSLRLGGAISHNLREMIPVGPGNRRYAKDTVLFSEAQSYQMLLRGHALASEPFRRWVTEVVIPSIRKTGSFNVNEAQDDTSRQYAGELAALHAEVSGLKAMVQQLLDRPVGSLEVPVVSPYEGTTMVALSDGLVFNKHTYREIGEVVGLGRLALDRLEGRAVLAAEVSLGKLWAAEDGRALKSQLSKVKRKWTLWPQKWVKTKMDRALYRAVLLQVINEKATAL